MQTQFQYIKDLSTLYMSYSANSNKLYDALNAIPLSIIEKVYRDYGNPENRFQPVNLLRAEVARQLLAGNTVDAMVVEGIKSNIRTKKLDHFSHLSPEFVKELEDYAVGKRDMFANWQKPWSIFHTFFYNRFTPERETTQNYLDQIGADMLHRLNLKEYSFHTVDFQGPSNFGMDRCWIAWYPTIKNSHKDSYQFFVSLEKQPWGGMNVGSNIKNPESPSLSKVDDYEALVDLCSRFNERITTLNSQTRNYFKFAPGAQASEWTNFYNESVAALHFDKLGAGDLSKIESYEELNIAAGFAPDADLNQTGNLWMFKSANIGDVLFVNKGVNISLGIGIIEGDYYYDSSAEYKHRRKVKWLTDKVYNYKSGSLPGYKNLFRPDTFSPTKVWEFILNEYIRMFPELENVFAQNNIHQAKQVPTVVNEDASDYEVPEDFESDSTEPLNFLWLNANPKMWKIAELQNGQTQTYTTHNERGNKRNIYKYFVEAKPGDLVIGYESTPSKQIKAIFEITKGIHINGKEEEIEFQLLDKLEIPVNWNELKSNPLLDHCRVLLNNQGSLFKLTEEEYDIIREIIDNKNIAIEQQESAVAKKYNFAEDEDKPFISEEAFNNTVALLKRKKNIILQGPPGVGKTFIARKIAYEILGEVKDSNIEMVQFHQSYSYEDFIQGLRPTQKGGFELKDGVFYNFCRRALAHPEKPFFFIIDEINRGNLSKIFGELMMLIEADKRHEKYALKLTYAEDEHDRFYVPENFYIIGTMNTADRSLAMVDYALRRRFAFIGLQPDYGNNFQSFLNAKGLSQGMVNHICEKVSHVNDKIKLDRNLGEGFQIGHSYFCGFSNTDENSWWNDILKFELKPLLEEIWFDDSSQVNQMVEALTK